MYDEIVTENFSELEKWHRGSSVSEFSSRQEAHVAFVHAMQSHGYRLDTNGTWLKVGFAAVMEP